MKTQHPPQTLLCMELSSLVADLSASRPSSPPAANAVRPAKMPVKPTNAYGCLWPLGGCGNLGPHHPVCLRVCTRVGKCPQRPHPLFTLTMPNSSVLDLLQRIKHMPTDPSHALLECRIPNRIYRYDLRWPSKTAKPILSEGILPASQQHTWLSAFLNRKYSRCLFPAGPNNCLRSWSHSFTRKTRRGRRRVKKIRRKKKFPPDEAIGSSWRPLFKLWAMVFSWYSKPGPGSRNDKILSTKDVKNPWKMGGGSYHLSSKGFPKRTFEREPSPKIGKQAMP